MPRTKEAAARTSRSIRSRGHRPGPLRAAAGVLCAALACAAAAGAGCPGAGTVVEESKLSATSGGFEGSELSGGFGLSVASIGDFDGDGVGDIAVGDQALDFAGGVWVLLLNADGTVKGEQAISAFAGGFDGALDIADLFGSAVASLGDLDGDGVGDLAVGAERDDDGSADRGAAWVLFLNADGTVKAQQKISATQGGFTGELDSADFFGHSVAAIGDHDGDGVVDIAVGAPADDDGPGFASGAVWLLFLNTDGTVKSHQKISATSGGFDGNIEGDNLGSSITSLGDLDGDGVGDLAVGAEHDGDGGMFAGAVWVLFLNTDGTVKAKQKISPLEGGLAPGVEPGDFLGSSVSAAGDLDGDGVADLAVGARGDDDGGDSTGAVWVLFLNTDGTVKTQQKVSPLAGDFGGQLSDDDLFGGAAAWLGDHNGDGSPGLAVGARGDDDGPGDNHGAVWLLSLDGCGGPAPCPGDIVPGGGVNSADLNALLAAFGEAVTPGSGADITGDGLVDSQDLNALLAAFGGSCP